MAGEILKKRREDLGRDVREIADLLKINAAYLVAIENDRFSELPAPVYTMGYIRCYAKYLDIDAGAIIEHYTKNLAQPEHTTIIPIAFSQKKVPKMYYVIPFGVCAIMVAFFFGPRLLTMPYKAITAVQGDIRVARTVPPSTAQPPAETRSLSTGEHHPEIAAQPPPETSSVSTVEHHLEITATDTVWLSAKFVDGRSEEALLQAGDSKGVKFSEKVILKLGNAGGVSIRLDEKDLGVPGNRGQVMTLSLPPGEAPSPVTSP